MKRIVTCFSVIIMLCGIQFRAQAQQPRKTELEIGDDAPALSILKWVKGEPVPGFEKGKVYLIEFTGLFCGPCHEMIPHLKELAGKYAGKITVISVFDVFMSSDQTGIGADKLVYADMLDEFVKKQGDTLNYSVALDMPKNVTVHSWLHTLSAPTAYIVDGDGKIAWIGHPGNLHTVVLDQFVNKKNTKGVSAPQEGAFRQTIDGHATGLYYIRNKKGDVEAAITNYGARLVYLQVPGRAAAPVSVVAGFDSLSQYVKSPNPYYGATIGRVVDGLSKKKLVLDGHEYDLAPNFGPDGLIHGGPEGFYKKVWDARQINASTLELTLVSPDGEGGFPGNLRVTVRFSIEKEAELKITYEARTDRPTVINLSNRIFFNLNGEGSGNINGHLLTIHADKYTPQGGDYDFPTGAIDRVEGTVFDFRKPMTIGARVDDTARQLLMGGGYDHYFVLDQKGGNSKGLASALVISGDKTGIMMEVKTTEPGIEFYGGNDMLGMVPLRTGAPDGWRTAFVVRPQHFPDAPNQPAFGSIGLGPGEKYYSESRFSFSCK